MSKKTVRAISLGIVIALVLGIVAGVVLEITYGKTDAERIQEEQQKKESAQENLDEINVKKEKSLEVMEGIEKEIGDIQIRIDALDANIAETTALLEEEEVKLEEATTRAETQYDVFKERFRIMCEQGDVTFIEMILSAGDFNTLIDKVEVMNEIAEYDKQIFDTMEKNRQDIEKSRDEIARLKQSLEDDKAELETQRGNLEQKRTEQREYMAELESDAATYQKIIDEADAAMEDLRRRATNDMNNNPPPQSGTTYKATGTYTWPTPSCHYITSHFSPRRKNPVTGVWKRHTGTDIGAAYGADIVAADSGTVTLAGWNSGYGYCVIINHGGGRATLYAHMSSYSVSAGQSVQQGQRIGKVGSTGNSTGPHLHFEVMINGQPVDPMQFF